MNAALAVAAYAAATVPSCYAPPARRHPLTVEMPPRHMMSSMTTTDWRDFKNRQRDYFRDHFWDHFWVFPEPGTVVKSETDRRAARDDRATARSRRKKRRGWA